MWAPAQGCLPALFGGGITSMPSLRAAFASGPSEVASAMQSARERLELRTAGARRTARILADDGDSVRRKRSLPRPNIASLSATKRLRLGTFRLKLRTATVLA